MAGESTFAEYIVQPSFQRLHTALLLLPDLLASCGRQLHCLEGADVHMLHQVAEQRLAENSVVAKSRASLVK